MCDNLLLAQILYIAKIFFQIICYVIPPIVIIVSIIELSKVALSGKDEEFKVATQNLVKRIIAGLIVFLLPTAINYVFTNFSTTKIEFMTCFNAASKKQIEELKKKEEDKKKAEQEAEKVRREKEYKEYAEKAKEAEQKKKEEKVTINTSGLSLSEFNQKMSSMSTPSISQLEQAASQNGIDSYYLKIIIGTTQNEGYYNDSYLNYGWASAMINNRVTVAQMQGWDPSRSGEANYYSETHIMQGYNSASSNVLKSVYLALTNRNTKIVECNGMYSTTPSSYNKIYTSSNYSGISIYEVK